MSTSPAFVGGGAIAVTPDPPYYAVIFTSQRAPGDAGYSAMAKAMESSVSTQPGYLGMESVREGIGITVSYWRDLESIAAWKSKLDHTRAQRLGRERWYTHYTVRIARVEREYSFDSSNREHVDLSDEHI